MQCISKINAIPPGGCTCVCPGTNITVSAGSVPELIHACGDVYIEQFGSTPINFAQLVENAVCERSPGWKYCEPCVKNRSFVTFGGVLRFIKAMMKFVASGGKLVSQETADRRAAICAGCPYNVDTPDGCFSCHGIQGFVNLIKGDKSTASEQQLKTCGICSCFLSVLVWMPVETVNSQDVLNASPDHCWKKTETLGAS